MAIFPAVDAKSLHSLMILLMAKQKHMKWQNSFVKRRINKDSIRNIYFLIFIHSFMYSSKSILQDKLFLQNFTFLIDIGFITCIQIFESYFACSKFFK